jgi:hypothetical protein
VHVFLNEHQNFVQLNNKIIIGTIIISYSQSTNYLILINHSKIKVFGRFLCIPHHNYCLITFQLFAIIVFGCISSQGWVFDSEENKEVCLYNKEAGACNYGVFVGVFAFLGAIAFLVGEFLFERMSSVKTRKHYVLGDLGFSGRLTLELTAN